jgi:3-methylcrotonyl-CoA carboxylase alpha subunit
LRENFLVGPRDNLGFLARLIDTRAVRAADLDTDLIDRERGALFADPEPLPREAWLAALAALLLDEAAADPSSAGHRGGAAPGASPWAARDGFRLAGTYQRRVTLASTTNGEERRVLQVRYAADGWQVTFDDAAASGSTGGTAAAGDTVALRATHEADGMLALGIDGRRLIAQTFVHDGTLHVRVDGRQAAVAFIDPREPSGGDEAAEGGLRSPMPGRVVVLHVRAGDRVRRGAALLALEAMKMEHVITAPADGVVEAVHVTEGAQVAEAVTLVDFKAD